MTDGSRVLFVNVGSTLKCSDFAGSRQWPFMWGPFGRHYARQHENALVSISDLGPAGETWSLLYQSFSDGRLYARTLKEVICIGPAE